MIPGAQLYTLRQFTQREDDLARTLHRVAALGYTSVQISAIGPIPPARVRALCDAHGLAIVLTHTDPERILKETEAVIEEHELMGCSYIGIGIMPERYRYDGWIGRFSEDFKGPAEKIARAGKLLMYHNHDFEFSRIGGSRVIDRLLTDFPPEELGITLDTYWLQRAGCDVCAWIERLAGRLPCVHLKDMDVICENGQSESVMAPVMEGNMNFPAIIEALGKAGSKYLLVEQDICREDPFLCMEKSLRNLQRLLV